MFQLPYKKSRMCVLDDLSIRLNGAIMEELGRTLRRILTELRTI